MVGFGAISCRCEVILQAGIWVNMFGCLFLDWDWLECLWRSSGLDDVCR